MLCAMFSGNFTISLLSPLGLGKGRGLSFKQTQIPSTQRCFVPNLVEIGPAVLKHLYFCYFAIMFRWKGMPLYLANFPFTQYALCQVRMKFAQQFWRGRWKSEKFTDGLQTMRTAQLAFQLRWAKYCGQWCKFWAISQNIQI